MINWFEKTRIGEEDVPNAIVFYGNGFEYDQ